VRAQLEPLTLADMAAQFAGGQFSIDQEGAGGNETSAQGSIGGPGTRRALGVHPMIHRGGATLRT